MGWWDEKGTHVIGLENYIAGYDQVFAIRNHRDFFTFDLSLADGGRATSATLQIPIGTGSGDYGEVAAIANFVLHDVSTDPVTLNTTAGPGSRRLSGPRHGIRLRQPLPADAGAIRRS